MKRFTVIFLVIAFAFSLYACGEEQITEKYCWNCGKGITKEASFCEYCGTKLNETQGKNESSDVEESENSSSAENSEDISKMEESQPAETSKEQTEESTGISKNESTLEPEKPIHTHTYSKIITEPTCTENGYTTYTCSCGDTYKDKENQAKGHVWGSWETISASDIGKTGEEKRICSTCKTSEKRQIPALQEDTTKIWFVNQYSIAKQQYINRLNKDKTLKQDKIQTLRADASALYVSYMQEVKNIKERYPNSSTRDVMLQNAQQNYTNAAQSYTKQISDLELEISAIETEIEKPNVDNILSIVTDNCKITSKETYEYYYKYSSELS